MIAYAKIAIAECGTPRLIQSLEEKESMRKTLKPFSGKEGLFITFHLHEDPTEQHVGFYHAVVVPFWQHVKKDIGEPMGAVAAEYEIRSLYAPIREQSEQEGISEPKDFDRLSRQELNEVIENIKHIAASFGYFFEQYNTNEQ